MSDTKYTAGDVIKKQIFKIALRLVNETTTILVKIKNQLDYIYCIVRKGENSTHMWKLFYKRF